MEKLLVPTTVAALMVVVSASAASEEKKFTFSAEAGVEYSDNITVSVLDETTGRSDHAYVLDLSAGYLAVKNDSQELELTYDFSQSLYDTLDDYDLQIHTLSALGTWEINDLDVGLNYSFSKVYLGGDDLYDSHTLTPNVGFQGMEAWYHRLSYAYLDRDFTGSVSERDAEQHSLSSDNYFFFMDYKAYVSLGLRLEEEDTKSPEYDYQGTYLRLGTSVPLSSGKDGFKLKASYQHYWRDYDNVTASIGERRDDEQDLFSIELVKPVYESINAKFSYEYIDTDSNLPSVDAIENIFRFSFTADY